MRMQRLQPLHFSRSTFRGGALGTSLSITQGLRVMMTEGSSAASSSFNVLSISLRLLGSTTRTRRKPTGRVVTNTQQMEPMPVIAGLATYPENLVEKMQAKGIQVDAMDCLSLAEEAGSSKAVNMVLMGRLSHYFPDIAPEAWQASLEANVPPKALEINRKAFALGQKG